MPTDRLRFTLAHELGHLVLHSIPRADMEAEADRFAAELLMPEADIRQHLRFLTVQALVLLKKIWRVSMGALLKRAQDLQTISARSAKGLWMYFSRNGWRRREPVGYDLDPESPALLQGLIRYHYDQLDYSVEMLCKVLDWSVEDFKKLYPTNRLRLVS
jgi:Zn-dependent peptidase ImmA (M78 family)